MSIRLLRGALCPRNQGNLNNELRDEGHLNCVRSCEGVADYDARVRPLRDRLEHGILEHVPETELNGHVTLRLANTSNITFRGVASEALLLLLDQEGICASSGSACLADSDEPSHVVKAMKPDSGASRQMVRFSVGTGNTFAEIETAVRAVSRAVHALSEVA